MAKRFLDKVAIVTGAAGGIGAATAKRLYDEGASIGMIDFDAQGLAQQLDGLDRNRILTQTIDISAPEQCAESIAQVVEKFGQLDVLVNNAGVICQMQPLGDQPVDDWQRVLNINLIGAVSMTQAALPHLIASKGAIVNTASVAGMRSGAGGNAYSASKAAVINFTQTAACDLGAQGVRVNAVCPGLVETNMTKPVFDYARSHGKEEKLGSRCELRRAGHPDEIAAAIAFLASSDASFITGQALAVDGGNTASLNMPGMKF